MGKGGYRRPLFFFVWPFSCFSFGLGLFTQQKAQMRPASHRGQNKDIPLICCLGLLFEEFKRMISFFEEFKRMISFLKNSKE